MRRATREGVDWPRVGATDGAAHAEILLFALDALIRARLATWATPAKQPARRRERMVATHGLVLAHLRERPALPGGRPE